MGLQHVLLFKTRVCRTLEANAENLAPPCHSSLYPSNTSTIADNKKGTGWSDKVVLSFQIPSDTSTVADNKKGTCQSAMQHLENSQACHHDACVAMCLQILCSWLLLLHDVVTRYSELDLQCSKPENLK